MAKEIVYCFSQLYIRYFEIKLFQILEKIQEVEYFLKQTFTLVKSRQIFHRNRKENTKKNLITQKFYFEFFFSIKKMTHLAPHKNNN